MKGGVGREKLHKIESLKGVHRKAKGPNPWGQTMSFPRAGTLLHQPSLGVSLLIGGWGVRSVLCSICARGCARFWGDE